MKPGAKAALPAALVIAVSLLSTATADAQDSGGLRPGVWSGELELDYDAGGQRSGATAGAPGEFDNRHYRERVTLRNQGLSYLDPRLLTANVALTFALFQDQARSDGTQTTKRGKLTGYALDSTFLAEKPYNATLFANRSENFFTQPFGGRTQSSVENHGGVLRLREDSPLRDRGLPYFSGSLQARQEHVNETTTSFGETLQRDEHRDILDFNSHKGFATSDLDLRYEFADHRGTGSPFSQNDFQTHNAGLLYSGDFGPRLNRRWDSRWSYFERTGRGPLKLMAADQHLHIDHYENLFTDYRYLLTRVETQAGPTTTHNGAFRVQHRLYRNLTSSAQLTALRTQLPAGSRTSYGGGLALDYRHGLPRDGRLFVAVAGRYQVNDNELSTSRIDIVDEPFSAPSPLGAGAGFTLAHPFVIAASIVVVDTRGGARLSTTAGVDYEVVQEGDLTRIVPLATSLIIQPGDPLAVSYTYEVDPSLRYDTVFASFNSGVDFRWIAFSFGHQQTGQRLRSGRPGTFLQDVRSDRADLRLRGARGGTRAEAGAALERYEATFLAYDRQRLDQLVTYRPARNWTLSLRAEEAHTDYRLPPRSSDTRSLQAAADWLAANGWWMSAFARRRVFADSLSPTETINEASLRARKFFQQSDIASALTYGNRTRDPSRITFWRVELRMTRRF